MNYSTNKVQVSYFVELPQSNFPDYTNSLTFPWLWAFPPDFSLTLAEFPDDISRFPEIPEKYYSYGTAKDSCDTIDSLIDRGLTALSA